MHILSNAEILKIRKAYLSSLMKDAEGLIERSAVKGFSYREKIRIQQLIVSSYYRLRNYNMPMLKTALEGRISEILNAKSPSNTVIDKMYDFCLDLQLRGDRFAADLQSFITEGERIKKQEKPTYPALFDKQSSIFVVLEERPMSVLSILYDRIKRLNAGLPYGHSLSLSKDENSPRLIYTTSRGTQAFSAFSFFKRRRRTLVNLCDVISAFDVKDKVLIEILNSGNFKSYKALKKERNQSNSSKNAEFLKLLSDEFLFYRLYGELKKHPERSIAKNIARIKELYIEADEQLTITAQRGVSIWDASDDISYIQITKSPYNIATLSTYKDWKGCFSMDEKHDKRSYLPATIGKGALVAYGLNKDLKKVSRLILAPYQNEKGETIYAVGCLNGQYCTFFIEAVQRFVADNLNAKADGVYQRVPDVIPDNFPNQIMQYKKAQDLFDAVGQDYQKTKDGKIILPDSFYLEDVGLAQMPDFSNVEIPNLFSLANNRYLTRLENMPKCKVLKVSSTGITSFEGVRDGTQIVLARYNKMKNINGLPASVHALALDGSTVEEGIDVSKLKGFDDIFLSDTSINSIGGLPASCKRLKIGGTKITTLSDLNVSMSYVDVSHCDIKTIHKIPLEIALIICGLNDANQKDVLNRLAESSAQTQQAAYDKMMQLPKDCKKRQMNIFEQWKKSRVKE